MTRLSRSEERKLTSSAMILGMVSASERMAPVQGLQPRERRRRADPLLFAGERLHEGLLDGDERVAAHEHAAVFGEVERHDGDVFEQDVVPDVELGPVGEREDADAFAGGDAGVVEVPELGALVLGVPLAGLVAEGEDALLGAGFFFVAARAAEGRVETVLAEAVEESRGLEQAAAALGAEADGVGAVGEGLLVAPDA